MTWILTRNYFREMIRDRTISILFFSAIFLLLISALIGTLSLDEQRRILVHLGFASIHWTSVGLVIFLGGFAIQREIERQTCLMVLARSVSRSQFLISKILGILGLVGLHLIFQGILMWVLLAFVSDAATSVMQFATVLFGIFVECAVVLAFVLAVVQWVRPLVAVFAGLGLSLAGNWLEEVSFLSQRQHSDLGQSLLKWFVPHFYILNLRTEKFVTAMFDFKAMTALFVPSFIHFAAWFALFVIFSVVSFFRRDLV